MKEAPLNTSLGQAANQLPVPSTPGVANAVSGTLVLQSAEGKNKKALRAHILEGLTVHYCSPPHIATHCSLWLGDLDGPERYHGSR